MKKRICCILFATLLCVNLTACTKIPNLSEEQEELVSEYAAALLLKYDSENHSRLVDISETVSKYEAAQATYSKGESEYYEKLSAEEQKRIDEAREQEEKNKEYADSTTVVDVSSNESDYNKNNATIVDLVSISDFFGFDGFSIDYAGADTLDEYPEYDEGIGVTMTALSGKQLLVVYFNVYNSGSSDANLNVYATKPTFKLSVNGEDYHNVETTILEDDLSSYNGTIGGGETIRLVLVTEVKKGTVVSGLSLKIVDGANSMIKTLK